MSETISKIFESKLHWVISIAIVVATVAGVFYNLSTRVAVNEQQITNLEGRLKEANDTAKSYKELADSINGRLARIEGALSVK